MSPEAAKIAVIDDEPEVRSVIERLLESGGFRVVSTTEPTEALEFVRREVPDLVLCDIAMPGMDGYSVLKALQADPETAGCPVIFITAHREFSERVQAFRFGVVDYITKPFAREVLLRKIERVLRERAQRGRRAGRDAGATDLLADISRDARSGILSVEGASGLSRVVVQAGHVVAGSAPAPGAGARAEFQELDPTREQIATAEPSSLPLGQGALPDLRALPEALRSVLVVDDNPFFRRFLRDLLTGQGFTVHEADGGEAALAIALERQPWLILADVNLPGHVDGLELCRRVRSHSLIRHTPLIFLSGWDEYEDRHRGLEAGADEYLSKQTPVRELLIRMQLLLKRYADLGQRGRRDAAIKGRLEAIGAPAVLQICHLGRLSGTLAVRDAGREAEVGFRDGDIVSARAPGLTGTDAVFAFLAWSDGSFEFAPGDAGSDPPLGESFEQLVLEGCRRLDENSRAETGEA